MAMRIVLRKISTGLFLNPADDWTAQLDEARCFKHSAEAMDVAREQHLEGTEVLLTFEDPPRQVSFPLP